MAAVSSVETQRLPPVLAASSAAASSRSSNTSNEKVNSVSPAPKISTPAGKSGRPLIEASSASERWRTVRTSFKYLCNLTPAQVDDFMDSYVIYNLDWANERAMMVALGPNYQERVAECLRAYYGIMNHLCALGDVEKMYIPPMVDRKASVLENQLLNEEEIARVIGLKDGDRVLDLGCGRGRVAAHMAKLTGARVTGLNIDPDQVAQARQYNDKLGLENDFVEADLNRLPLPFADGTFDAFYEIQALSLCQSLPALFKEVFRVLKPGAKFLLMDWVSLPEYDPSNPEHSDLMSRVKPLIGAVGTPTPASFESALSEAGFQVTVSDIPSIDGLQAPLIDKVDVYFRAMRQLILAAVKVRVLPRHFRTLINRLCLDGQAFVKMDRMRLITTVQRVVAEKP